jgi:hypothetical protein
LIGFDSAHGHRQHYRQRHAAARAPLLYSSNRVLLARSSLKWERRYDRRTAVERVNSRLPLEEDRRVFTPLAPPAQTPCFWKNGALTLLPQASPGPLQEGKRVTVNPR